MFTQCDEPVSLFADLDLDACANDSCCDQITLCAADPTLCFDDLGNIDESFPGGDDLYECIYRASCIGSPVCTSGIGFGDDPAPDTLELAYCLDQNCCEEMSFCTGSGDDPQGCIDCLNGLSADFDACEPVNGCSLESCDAALIFVPICESGLGTSSPSVGQCLDTNCCEEYLACTGGEDNEQGVQECIDCLLGGGGALCDAALACEAASCSTAICDSGLVIDDLDLAACLTESCCDEYTACAGDGSAEDVQACIDCFDAEGGELCDEAIACGELSCPEE